MKDFIIQYGAYSETNSLPEVIRLSQYRLYSNINNATSIWKRAGSIHDGSFNFSIDCRHFSLSLDEESESMKWVNETILNSFNPAFSKKELESKFYILEIPDYGSQSMSAFYRDFVPQVYVDGKKIWQKYIGMLKIYIRKTAFILIDKNNNIAGGILSSNQIKIHIAFKNNLELSRENNLSLKLEKNKEKTNEYYVENTSFLFISNINSFSDFYFYYQKNNEKVFINPIFIQSIEFSRENPDYIVSDQTGINEKSPEEILDYFKQQFQKNYLTETTASGTKTDYNRNNVCYKITLKLKDIDTSDISAIFISSKNNFYDAVYCSDIDSAKKQIGEVYRIFDENGYYRNEIKNNNSESNNYEIIPEYHNRRRIHVISTKTKEFEDEIGNKIEEKGETITNAILKKTFQNIFRFPLSNDDAPFVLAYDSLGAMTDLTNAKITNYFLYDNDEKEDTTTELAATASDTLKLEFSTDSESVLENITIGIEKSNGINVKFNNAPMSFYIYSKSEFTVIPDAYLIYRIFPIPMSKYKINNHILYYKLPDHYVSLDPNNGNEIINEKTTTKLFLNGFEQTVTFSPDFDANNWKIYNINYLNKNLKEKNTNEKNFLGNSNIVNYKNRNTKQ